MPAQSRQAEALGDHALAGEGRVAGNEQRHHHGAVLAGAPCWSCLARTLPSTTGLTISRDATDWRERKVDTVAVELAIGGGAEVILHVARAFDLVRRVEEPPLNSWKIARCGLPITCASTLSRPRCAMPMTICFTPSAPPRLMICSSAGIIDPRRRGRSAWCR